MHWTFQYLAILPQLGPRTGLLLCWLLLPSLPAQAESWSKDEAKSMKPVNAENRIIKWCEEDGERVRYASANITLKGYQPCGKLEAQASCDAGGKRFISKTPPTHYAYKDCQIGQRIRIERSDGQDFFDKDTPPPPDSIAGLDQYMDALDRELDGKRSGASGPDPLSDREYKELQRKVDKLTDAQGQMPDIGQALNELMRAFNGAPLNQNRRGRRSSQKDPDMRELEKLLKTMFP